MCVRVRVRVRVRGRVKTKEVCEGRLLMMVKEHINNDVDHFLAGKNS